MRFEFINPFAEASTEVLSAYIEEEMRTSDILLRDSFSEISGVAVILGLIGDGKGNVLIDMTEETACKLASAMSGMEIYNYNELAASAVKELVNQVSGLAVTKLEKDGFDIGVTPPIVIYGSKIDYQAFKSESLHVKIETALGDIDILVALVEDDE